MGQKLLSPAHPPLSEAETLDALGRLRSRLEDWALLIAGLNSADPALRRHAAGSLFLSLESFDDVTRRFLRSRREASSVAAPRRQVFASIAEIRQLLRRLRRSGETASDRFYHQLAIAAEELVLRLENELPRVGMATSAASGGEGQGVAGKPAGSVSPFRPRNAEGRRSGDWRGGAGGNQGIERVEGPADR